MYWEEEKTLILSDLHFGKSGHFRKNGIAVPQTIFKEDLQRFVSLLWQFKPANTIIIGDMFHSHNNKEHELFVKWRKDFEQLPIQLVMGNHDLLHTQWYQAAGIEALMGCHTINHFCFAHDIQEAPLEEAFCFSGHIHPAINIPSGVKQSVQLPCFYFTKKYAVLPAFGKFTGTSCIKPKKGETVIAILPTNDTPSAQGRLIQIC